MGAFIYHVVSLAMSGIVGVVMAVVLTVGVIVAIVVLTSRNK